MEVTDTGDDDDDDDDDDEPLVSLDGLDNSAHCRLPAKKSSFGADAESNFQRCSGKWETLRDF